MLTARYGIGCWVCNAPWWRRVEFDAEAEVLVAHVRPRKGARRQCGRCGRRAGFDQGEGRRRWRALDLGVVQVVAGGRRAAGVLPRAWSDGGRGAVGAARRGAHVRVRRPGGVAGGADVEDGGGAADARRVAHGRGDRGPGRRRREGRGGPVGRPAPHRHRRDQLQEGPQVPDRRGRP